MSPVLELADSAKAILLATSTYYYSINIAIED